jgi:predicted KAP-like P-loop ATPase
MTTSHTDSATHKLIGDRPITSEEEDVFGFTGFAEAVAHSLLEATPTEGIVVSVEGEWGSGKTSALNLTERRIIRRTLARETNRPQDEIDSASWTDVQMEWDRLVDSRQTHVVRFDPWNFSGQDNLVRAFFAEVGTAIGHPRNSPIGRAIKKLTDYLPSVGTVVGGGAGALALGTPAAGPGATAGRAIGESAQRLIAGTGSLEGAKQQLRSALIEADKRIIVIIDNLDRLLGFEIRALFSMVKSLGDLPNVSYILSFDREAIKKEMKRGADSMESDFLEKIVQVPLKLPPPWNSELRHFFFQRVNVVLGDSAPTNRRRWEHVFFDAIAPYLRKPRDVIRICNILQVAWPNVRDEVDLTDFLTLTTLQACDDYTYKLIFDNIETLTGESMLIERDVEYAARFATDQSSNPKAARAALRQLFPRLARAWEEHVWDGASHLQRLEERRICTQEYHRNYFLFGRDPDQVSRRELEGILTLAAPTAELKSLISALASEMSRRGVSKVAAFLDQVQTAVSLRPVLSQGLVEALLSVSDELIEREDLVWELFTTDNRDRLRRILFSGLRALSPDERDRLFRSIAACPYGLTLAVDLFANLASEHGLYGGTVVNESERLVGRALLDEMQLLLLKRIRKAASEGTLLATPRPLLLIRRWQDWAGPEEVKVWLSSQLDFDKSVLRLAEVLPAASFVSGGDGRRIEYRFKAKLYSEILDVSKLKEKLRHLADRSPDGRAAKIYERLIAAERYEEENPM